MSELTKKPFAAAEFFDPASPTNGINDGIQFEQTDALFANDVNKIVNNQMHLKAKKADLESPDFTGIPTAPTAANTVRTVQIATTQFVHDTVDQRASNVVPLMNGAAVAGANNGMLAREGHVHPTDTTRAATVHTNATGANIGQASASVFGHAIASNSNPVMDGAVSQGTDNGRYARADHRHPVDTTRAASNHTHTLNDLGAIPSSNRGAANGVASLDASTLVPRAQLPLARSFTRETRPNDTEFNQNRGTVTVTTNTAGNILYLWVQQ